MVKPIANRIDGEHVNQLAFIILAVIDKFLRGFDQLFRSGHVFVSLLVFGWLYRLNSRRLDPVREWLAENKLRCFLDLCVLKVGDEIHRRLRFARRLDDQAFVVFQRLQPTVQVLRVIRARSGANA